MLSTTHYFFNRQECIVVLYILALVADSLLTFKTTILTTIGIYMLGMIQIAFKDGRPFWDVAAISSNGHCRIDFGSPNEQSFLMTFFYPYIITMYLFKYAPRPNVILNLILILVLVVMWAVVYFQGLANGLAYIYQCVAGQLLGLIYLIGCLTFDDEIHRYCEKTGFILRSSRARKFYLFFFTLFLLTLESIIYLSLDGTWNMPQDWIVNANFYSQHCKWLFK